MAMVALDQGIDRLERAAARRSDFQDSGIGQKTNPKLKDSDDTKEANGNPRHRRDAR